MRAWGVPAVVIAAVALLLALIAGSGLIGRPGTGEDPADAPSAVSAPTGPEASSTTAPAATTVTSGGLETEDERGMPTVGVRPHLMGRELPALRGLPSAAVVRLQATGFEADRTGSVRQCLWTGELHCAEDAPVRFDQDGRADAQFQVQDRVRLEDGRTVSCLDRASRCVLEVSDGEDTGLVDTGFGNAAVPDLVLERTSPGAAPAGRVVEVVVSGAPASSSLQLMLCLDTDGYVLRCRPFGAETPASAGGGVTQSLIVSSDDAAWCDDDPCLLTAFVDGHPGRVDPLLLSSSVDGVVDYDRGRVVIGLVIAGVLLAVAGWVIRRTDWSPPRAADGAELDRAAFADLDAEARRFEDADSAP